MSPTFASLSIRNYRIYFTGALLSNVGTWMGRVAQDWLVLVELTDHDSTALGIVTALQFAPVVLLAPVAGTLADRFRKRRVLAITQTGLAVTAALLALLTLTGVVQLWQVYLLAALQGFFTAADNPARQAFVSEMVPPERLGNAVGLNSASFNAARLIGPAVAGLLIAWVGTGWTLVVNTFSFVAVLVALQMMRGNELHPAPRGKGRGGLREGLAYVRHRPDLMLIMAIVFMLGTFGMNFQITTALMATTVFHKGATEFGLLGSIMAIGSLSAALLSARRSQPRLRVLLGALAGFVVASAGAATAPTYELFALWLIPVGLTALTVLPTANTMVQLSVAPHLRGRVMALYMAIFLGGTPIGAPLIGWIGAEYGARWTIGIGSVATAVAVVAATMYVMRTDDLRVRYRLHERPHLQVMRRGEAAEAVTPEQVA
ncbi:putative MFS family arabinose efflux permease [Barrientosiimonas humi]|nr:MFS transporter [Barrientosiimonas humi]TQL34347.1 putative MFS family arabinose efflux permease [Barrientosiimonas humi]CAG7574339.1 putative multidrug-efflux transporter [Barrientosiimonas humi]